MLDTCNISFYQKFLQIVVCFLLWWTAVDMIRGKQNCKQICSGMEIPCWLKGLLSKNV